MTKIAILTGASSGLGKEYAKQLDKHPEIERFWLIARRKERLEELAKTLITPCLILPLDLSKAESFQTLKEELATQKPDITWLVNGAGMGKIGKSTEISIEDNANMVDLNCKALTEVTTICLPYMHKGSRILEIASIAAYQPMPYLNVYAASKAFVQSYSKALHHELRPEGIHVTCVCPYWIKDTEFIGIAQKDGASYYRHKPLAEYRRHVVAVSLFDSGYNALVSAPGIVSKADRIASKIIPHWLYMFIMDAVSRA